MGQISTATLVLIDEMGRSFPTPVQLWVDRSAKIDRKLGKVKTGRRLFENRHCAKDELVQK